MVLATALMTAELSSMWTRETFSATGVCELAGEPEPSRRKLETAAAESEPETIPATTATATIAPEPRERRSPDVLAMPAIGGRVDQAGTGARPSAGLVV